MTSGAPMLVREGAVLKVSGDVDAGTVLGLRKQGEQAIRQAEGALDIDLSGLGTAHTVVLSMLLCWQRLAQSRHCQLSFTGASERLRSLAALSNLQDQIPGFSAHG
ncbi:STAS domain-containing protein [Marinobacter sp. VGCF2001]|uniref:STAS domain-containing protein n=1 Tax=Marinobacter sp. VGCF2001 TaxID=3417189 RepID=UPI003CEBFA42